jgi:hypothetical protein
MEISFWPVMTTLLWGFVFQVPWAGSAGPGAVDRPGSAGVVLLGPLLYRSPARGGLSLFHSPMEFLGEQLS